MTAARPSRASALPDNSDTVRASSDRHCSILVPVPAQTSRLVAASAFGAPAASSSAIANDASASSASGTTLVTMPMSSASAAPITGLVNRIDIARRRPTNADSGPPDQPNAAAARSETLNRGDDGRLEPEQTRHRVLQVGRGLANVVRKLLALRGEGAHVAAAA